MCKNQHLLIPHYDLGADKAYRRCKKCNLKIRINEKYKSYMKCEFNDCKFNICRRQKCIPEKVLVEIENDDSLGSKYRKKDESIDEVYINTETQKERTLTRVYLHPSEEKED